MASSIQYARLWLLLAWAAYALLWAAAVSSHRWAWPGSGLLVVAGFGLGLLWALVALGAALAFAVGAIRERSVERGPFDIALVAASAVGLGAQAYYAWRFLVG